jgi:ketosteroid isomerase-like protein
MTDIASTILHIFRAVEERDAERFVSLCHPDATFHWPPSLPYGTRTTDFAEERDQKANAACPSWETVWDPLQPTRAERSMDPQVIGPRGDEVVVHWHQRGVDSDGGRLDEQVLGLYRVREGKLVRAQMFYFDSTLVSAFLRKAHGHRGSSSVHLRMFRWE